MEDRENLEAEIFRRNGQGDGKEVEIVLKRKREIKGGVEGNKEVAEAIVRREGKTRRAGEYFIKEPIPSRYWQDVLPAEILTKYRELKEAGVSVVPTLRISRNRILMTDLSGGGKNFIFCAGSDRDAEQRKLVSQFELSNPELVREKVHEAAEKAAKAQYRLNADAYFIVVTPMGGITVVVGDLGLGVTKESDEYVKFRIKGNLQRASKFYEEAMKMFGIKDYPPFINNQPEFPKKPD